MWLPDAGGITALVCGGVFCGKPSQVRVYLRAENMVKMIPQTVELSELEREEAFHAEPQRSIVDSALRKLGQS